MSKADIRSAEASAYRYLYKTARWQRLRKQHLWSQPLCKICSDAGITTAADVVDHIQPHRGDRELFFASENLQSLCKPCHDSVKQIEEKAGFNPQVGIDGRPIDPRHPGFN